MPVPGLLLTYCKYCTAPRNYRCIRKRFCVSLLEGNTTPFHHTHTPTSYIPCDDTQDSLPASSLSRLPSFFLSFLLFFSFFFLFFLFPLPPNLHLPRVLAPSDTQVNIGTSITARRPGYTNSCTTITGDKLKK